MARKHSPRFQARVLRRALEEGRPGPRQEPARAPVRECDAEPQAPLFAERHILDALLDDYNHTGSPPGGGLPAGRGAAPRPDPHRGPDADAGFSPPG